MDNIVEKKYLNVTHKNRHLPSIEYTVKAEKEIKKLMFLEKLVQGDLNKLVEEHNSNKPFKNKNIKKLISLIFNSSIIQDSTQIVVSKKISDKIVDSFTANYRGIEKTSKGDIFKAEFKDRSITIMLKLKDDEYFNALFIICRLTYNGQEVIRYTTLKNDFTNGELVFYVIKNKIPRVFVDCPYLGECEKANIISIFGIDIDCCMKTARTLHNCKTIENSGTFVTFCFLVLTATSTVSELLNNVKTYTKVETDNRIDTKKDNNKVEYKSNFITVYSNSTNFEKHYKVKSSTGIGTGTVKAEHIRREHTRTLKNGKVIPVRQSTINKGKGKKPYYLR
jgi:hypothetical protein